MSTVAPPHSFINVADFAPVEALVETVCFAGWPVTMPFLPATSGGEPSLLYIIDSGRDEPGQEGEEFSDRLVRLLSELLHLRLFPILRSQFVVISREWKFQPVKHCSQSDGYLVF